MRRETESTGLREGLNIGKENMKGSECNLQARGWRDWCRQGRKEHALSSNLPQAGPLLDFLGLQMHTLLPACITASLPTLLPPTPQPPLRPAASLSPGPHKLGSDAGHGPSCLLRTGLGPFFFHHLISQQNLSSVASLRLGWRQQGPEWDSHPCWVPALFLGITP